MSELKDYDIMDIEAMDDERLEKLESGKIQATRVYIKSEADKVIADLEEKHKTEVKELLCLIRDKENNFNRAFDSVEKELRHQKYKRFLAMAEMCNARYYEEDAKVNGCGASWEYISKEMKYWDRWRWRWLKIAEQFKEGV